MNLGDRLLKLRKEKNFSQEEVAEKLNVTRQTISKWETNQSMPDLDKVGPLCKLYGISVDHLLNGTLEENPQELPRKKNYFYLLLGIFGYFLAVIWIILGSETLQMNEGILVSGFLLICAVSTISIINYALLNPKKEKEESKEEKTWNELLALIFLVFYLLISFKTGAWHTTWIIWIVYAIVEEIIKLVFAIKGETHGKNN